MDDVLYHGTKAGFRGKGGIVLPGEYYQKDNHRLGRSDWVYVTPDLEMAWHWAEAAQGRGKPRVLIVRPISPLEVDDSTVGGQEHEAYRCKSARVLKVLFRDTPHPRIGGPCGQCREKGHSVATCTKGP